jgi:hypothetical protein
VIRPLSTTVLAALALTISGAGCGSDEDEGSTGEPAIEAPAASSFPKPGDVTIDEFIADVGETNEIVASPAGGVFTPGKGRFGFGLFDVAGPQIDDADTAVYLQHSESDTVEGPFPARTESLEVEPPYRAETAGEGDPSSVYVAEVNFDEEGEWRAAAVVRDADGTLRATNLQTAITVAEQPKIPDIGEEAPSVHTPTLDDVADVSEIDTRVPPSTMHEEDLADVLGKEPVVLLFATPALCLSRVCGPVVDVAEQVKAEYDDQAAFIHMEIYEENEYDPKKPDLRPQVEAYGLPTEPWLFVIDKEGRVQTRIEGAFSPAELAEAIEDVAS